MNQINAKELRAIRAEDVPEAYQDIVEALGLEVFLTLTDLCGGLNLYIPKRESLEREGRGSWFPSELAHLCDLKQGPLGWVWWYQVADAIGCACLRAAP